MDFANGVQMLTMRLPRVRIRLVGGAQVGRMTHMRMGWAVGVQWAVRTVQVATCMTSSVEKGEFRVVSYTVTLLTDAKDRFHD